MIEKGIKRGFTLLIVVLVAFCGCSREKNIEKQPEIKTEKELVEENIEYTDCTVEQLARDMAQNSFRAKNKYNNTYLRLSGRIERFNSDGKYIILSVHDVGMYASVQCYLKNEEQKNTLIGLNVGDDITLLGKITGVGDVAEYSFDIHKFM